MHFEFSSSPHSFSLPPPVIAVLFFAAFIALAIVAARMAAKRRKELRAWCAANGLSFSEAKELGFDGRFPEFECLRQGDNRYADAIMEGEWRKRQILAFDYHYETHSTDSKGHRTTHRHTFSAVIIDSGLGLKPLLIRPEGLFDRVKSFFGAEDIDFESAEFSRAFYVKAQDRKYAYDVIHTRAMEHLLAAPRFHIQFAGPYVMAHRQTRFSSADFQSAADTISGLLDLLPDYLVEELRSERGVIG